MLRAVASPHPYSKGACGVLTVFETVGDGADCLLEEVR